MKDTWNKLGSGSLGKALRLIMMIASLAALVVYAAYFARFSSGSNFSTIQADWGTFGDFVGGTLNPIFSFLGLIALLLTISIQNKGLELSRKELELTRLELEATRTELKRSAAAQEATQRVMGEQSKTQLKQQFEGTFFAVLGQHNSLMSKIQENKALAKTLTNLHTAWRGDKFHMFSHLAFEECIEYLRMLHQALELISGNSMTNQFLHSPSSANHYPFSKEKTIYSEILKAHLGGKILCLIGYYAAFISHENNNNRFAELIRRYALLDNTPTIVSIGDMNVATAVRKHFNLDTKV